MALAKRWTPRQRPRKTETYVQPASGIAFVTSRVACTSCGTALTTFATSHGLQGKIEILCAHCGTFREAVPAPH